jgi:hypothetical protein
MQYNFFTCLHGAPPQRGALGHGLVGLMVNQALGMRLKRNKCYNLEPFDRFKSNQRHFVQGGTAINSRCIMIVIKVKMAASPILILLEFNYGKTTKAKHLKLCTGMPYC